MISVFLNEPSGHNQDEINRLAESFVASKFAMLAPLGVKCSIMGDVDYEDEKRLIEEAITLYNNSQMEGQAESLRDEYEKFQAVRNVFTLMHEYNLLSYQSVIDIKHLPELTLAFPVWFVHGKQELPDLEREEDPRPDNAIKFFSDCVGSREYSWLYQVYNRRTRPLRRFKGRDIMPLPIMKIMNQAKELFDYVVIMTPYHDIASKEWSDPNWLRNIDPIMVGFLKGLPHMFVLGRWSGTGIFPLLLDCIADTVNHLRINKHLLNNFLSNSYWYKGLHKEGEMLGCDVNSRNNGLEQFADRLLTAYDNGKVFEFLRGELAEDPDYAFPKE